MALWPSTSSGDVGSSIHSGRQGASSRIHVTACPTSQRWFASTICSNGIAARQHHHVHVVCLECECVKCSLVTRGQALRQQLCYCSDIHANVLCSPISLRMIASRRLSFSTSAPTFALNLKLDEIRALSRCIAITNRTSKLWIINRTQRAIQLLLKTWDSL